MTFSHADESRAQSTVVVKKYCVAKSRHLITSDEYRRRIKRKSRVVTGKTKWIKEQIKRQNECLCIF